MNLYPGDIAIDYSSARPSVPKMVAAKVRLAVRYISTNRANTKNMTPAEVAALDAGGIAKMLVWEQSQLDPLKGAQLGTIHGVLAAAYARDLGCPVWYPIIVAVDFDTTLPQIEIILDYIRAFKAVCSHPLWVYGEYDLIETCYLRGLIEWGWQTVAWSHRKVSIHAAVLQHATPVHPAVPLLGNVDDNTVLQSFAAWGTLPDTPSVPPSEDDMAEILLTNAYPGKYSGAVYPNGGYAVFVLGEQVINGAATKRAIGLPEFTARGWPEKLAGLDPNGRPFLWPMSDADLDALPNYDPTLPHVTVPAPPAAQPPAGGWPVSLVLDLNGEKATGRVG